MIDYKALFKTDANAVILPGAMVSGDVVLGKGCSVWYNAVIRADEAPIVLGDKCNIQDCAVLHVDHNAPLQLGDGVTVGHSAILHSCTIDNNTLIGMGSVVLNGAVIGKNCIIGAGSLVTGKTVIPDGWVAFGRPAKPVYRVTQQDIDANHLSAKEYSERSELYR